jgi:hypothetical protein
MGYAVKPSARPVKATWMMCTFQSTYKSAMANIAKRVPGAPQRAACSTLEQMCCKNP